MEAARLNLPVRARLCAIDIAGAPIEFDPTLDYEASWPGRRTSQRLASPLPAGGVGLDFEVPLPLEGAAPGDTLWLMLMSKTHVSAVPDIDAREGSFRETDLESGTMAISLADLLETTAEKPAHLQAVSELVFRCAMHALAPSPSMEKAAGATTKAIVSLEVRHEALSREARTWLDKHRGGRCRSLPPGLAAARAAAPFADPVAFQAAVGRMMERHEEAYVLNATSLALPDGRTGRFPSTPDDPLMAHLHVPSYWTRTGQMPAIAHLMQDAADRMPADAFAAEMADVDPGRSSAAAARVRAQLEMRLLSALAAAGMSEDTFTRVVAKQHAVTKGAAFDPLYATAVRVATQMATMAVTRVRYKADARVPALNYVMTQWTPEEQRRLLPAEFWKAWADTGKLPTPPPPAMPGVPSVHEFLAGKRVTPSLGMQHLALSATTMMNSATSQVLAAAAADMPRVRVNLKARSRGAARATRPPRRRPRRQPQPQYVVVTRPPPAQPQPALSTGEASRPSAVAATAARPDNPYTHAFVAEDDWSPGILAGKCNADDCDGTGPAAVVAFEHHGRLLHAIPDAQLTPSLRGLRDIHARMTSLFVPGTVSEPYVEKEATGAPSATAPKHMPMPRRGSPEASKFGEGGHAFGIAKPVAVVAAEMLRGLDAFPDTAVHPEDDARVRAVLEKEVRAAPEWLIKEPSLRMIMEGTGPVHPHIAPTAELFPGASGAAEVRKAAARVTVARAIKLHGFGPTWDTPFEQRTAREPMAMLADLLRVEAQPYEVRARSDREQWITNFYRGVGGAFSLRMRDMGLPTLAHTSAIDLRSKTRGVDIATFLLQSEHVALHSHTGAIISTAEWTRDVEPVLQAALEQHPMANYLREPQQQPAVGLQCLPMDALAALDTTASPVPSSSDAAIAAIMDAARRPDRTVLSTTVDLEQLRHAGPARTRALVDALDALKADGHIIDYAFLHEQPLAQCPACLQVPLLLPVGATLDEKLFPRL